MLSVTSSSVVPIELYHDLDRSSRVATSRGALLADLAIVCSLPSNIPNSLVVLLAARTVEKGGGQEPEGDDAEVCVSGCELLGRLHTCVHPNGFVF